MLWNSKTNLYLWVFNFPVMEKAPFSSHYLSLYKTIRFTIYNTSPPGSL
ncbi:hypothetical protein [Paraflavitalea speifideaquila]|nr:hypothetical protein [Paraflavitalea speifideiaquila]